MNYSQISLAIIAALSASLALADDFNTTAEKEYKNATVSRVEADGIVIKFHGGIAKIFLSSCLKRFRHALKRRLSPKPPFNKQKKTITKYR
jgi:hypothetical protein